MIYCQESDKCFVRKYMVHGIGIPFRSREKYFRLMVEGFWKIVR